MTFDEEGISTALPKQLNQILVCKSKFTDKNTLHAQTLP